jgi:uncharacterized protein with NRDE domain
MCLIVWDWDPASRELMLLGNRDEYYNRPTLPLHMWPDSPVYAGRDEQAQGTWLGCSHSGRFAALTNFRSGQAPNPKAVSRGELVRSFLNDRSDSQSFLKELATHSDSYNGFNLLVFDGQKLCGFESHTHRIHVLPAGISGVSNAGFDTPWPKLLRSKSRLQQLKKEGLFDNESYFSLLADEQIAPDEALPETGISRILERQLSSVFVKMTGYGTRASSLVRLRPDGISITERSFDASGLQGTVHLQWPLSH